MVSLFARLRHLLHLLVLCLLCLLGGCPVSVDAMTAIFSVVCEIFAMRIFTHVVWSGIDLGGIVSIALCHSLISMLTLCDMVRFVEVGMLAVCRIVLPHSSSEYDVLDVVGGSSSGLYGSSSLGGWSPPAGALCLFMRWVL